MIKQKMHSSVASQFSECACEWLKAIYPMYPSSWMRQTRYVADVLQSLGICASKIPNCLAEATRESPSGTLVLFDVPKTNPLSRIVVNIESTCYFALYRFGLGKSKSFY